MINSQLAESFLENALKLKGFWKASVREKIKMLVVFPFVLAVFVYALAFFVAGKCLDFFNNKKE